MIYGIAHVRGGDDKGRRWYKAGRRDRRNNTFNDYIDVADHLIAQRYTARGRIVGLGASAGGTLMGVVETGGPICSPPSLPTCRSCDVVNTLLDPDLPLTPSDYAEWGNPLASRAELEWLLSYSPYDNVAPGPYPAILAVAGLTDLRVTYWEPAKWVARPESHHHRGQADPAQDRHGLGAHGRFRPFRGNGNHFVALCVRLPDRGFGRPRPLRQ